MKSKTAVILLLSLTPYLHAECLSQDSLKLVTIFADSVITMGVKGIFLPSLFYKCTFPDSELVCHDQNDYDKLLYSYYTKNNEIVLNQKKWATDTIEIGDTIYVGFKEKRQIVKDISNFIKKPLDAFDEQYRRFVAVKAKYKNYKDVKNMVVVKESTVQQKYMDKLLWITRKAGYKYIMSTLSEPSKNQKSN
jgi:hypothetical protein